MLITISISDLSILPSLFMSIMEKAVQLIFQSFSLSFMSYSHIDKYKQIITQGMLADLQWRASQTQKQNAIIKVPLLFNFPPIECISKELTKLNSVHEYRICYLGPRWDNSLLFHKKYSGSETYEFDEKKVNRNSTVLSDFMTTNQFYKNQLYYRAFEGMNPTINQAEELKFQSRFESGNLDCAIKCGENQYDLFLRIDSNTRGNLFWFYFRLDNCEAKKNQVVKLNICNLTKSDTHYKKSLYPFISTSEKPEWSQDGMSHLTFKEKKLRYEFLYDRMKIRNFYELSFTIVIKNQSFIEFAYCIPYTYSNLLKQLQEIKSNSQAQVQVQVESLGRSLMGVNIPFLKIGHDPEQKKPVILITGRVHPGESNGSLIISSLMKHICLGSSPEAKYLREKVIIVIVPMLNPDGVILGNSRCGASGKDLNREFKNRHRLLFPEVYLIADLVEKISETHQIQLYLDFHGHSKKKNMFFFGPNYNITQLEYYKCRVFPKILSSITPIFRYYSCSYEISSAKKTTARAIMLNEMGLLNVYTVQTSLGFYYDSVLKKDMPFTLKKWQEIGVSFALAFKQFQEGNDQFEAYIENKKKKIFIEDKSTCLPNYGFHLSPTFKITKPKDIALIKIYEEIKQEGLSQKYSQGPQIQSNNEGDSSDSNNDEEVLEREKMYEFTEMIQECYQNEEKKKKSQYYQGKKSQFNLNGKQDHDLKERKRQRQRRKNNRTSLLQDELELLNQIVGNSQKEKDQGSTRKNIQTSIVKNRMNNKVLDFSRQRPIDETTSSSITKANEQPFAYKLLVSHQFLDEEVDFVSVEKKPSNKINVKMFNFSKMVQNPKPIRYEERNEPKINRQFRSKNAEKLYPFKSMSSPHEGKTPSFEINININMNIHPMHNHQHPKPNFIQTFIDSPKKEKPTLSFCSDSQEKQESFLTGFSSKGKGKVGFPPSFYRIKYHNSLRKKNELKEKKQVQSLEGLEGLEEMRNLSSEHGTFKKVRSIEERERERQEATENNHDGLFIKVKRFPVI